MPRAVPSFSRSATDDQFHAAIGRLTVYWAVIESAMDAMILDIFHHLGNPPGETAIPIAFKNKLRYLKRSRSVISFPLFDATRWDELLAEAKTSAVARQNIIHGVLVKYSHTKGSGFFVRRQPGTGVPNPGIKLTIAGIRREALTAMSLAIGLTAFAVLFHDEVSRQRQPRDEQAQSPSGRGRRVPKRKASPPPAKQ